MWRLRKSDYYRNSNFKLLAKLGCRNGRLGVKDSEMHLPVAVNVQMGDSFSDTVEMSKLADWLCGGSEKVNNRNSNFKLLAKLGCRNRRLGVNDCEMHLPVLLLMCRWVIVSLITSR